MKTHKGFTLLELLISLSIMGTMAMIGSVAWLNTTNKIQVFTDMQRKDEHVAIKNTLIAFAAESNSGNLPAPYTGSGYNSTCLDVTNSTIKALLAQYSSTSLININTDSSLTRQVRTCQRLAGLTYNQPVAGFGGATVEISYDAGVVYQTGCRFADSTCNKNIPGKSASYTATGWVVTAPDKNPIEYTTLPIQQAMWDETYARLIELRNVMMNLRIDMVRTNAADDATNWNHKPSLASSDKSGATASSNQGCFDGWYDLSAADVDVLEQYGLNKSLYGVTTSGAKIEYCRDYDLAGTNADSVPHIAALRINRSVSTTTAPDTTTSANNIFISF